LTAAEPSICDSSSSSELSGSNSGISEARQTCPISTRDSNRHRKSLLIFRLNHIAAGLKDFAGLTPLKADLEALGDWVREETSRDDIIIFSTDSLLAADRRWLGIKEYVSGLVAVRIREHDDAILMILRPELVKAVSRGGDPRKQLERRKFEGEIQPRQSFDTWQEEVQSHARSVSYPLAIHEFIFSNVSPADSIA
jgi:hypothetical protein